MNHNICQSVCLSKKSCPNFKENVVCFYFFLKNPPLPSAPQLYKDKYYFRN